MILVDTFEESERNHKLGIYFQREITRIGVKADVCPLAAGDFCFEGNGPEGTIGVGIERKTLHDMLNCIDDGHLTSQLVKLKNAFNLRVIILEGHWKPHDQTGLLMEGFSGGTSWGYCKNPSKVIYAKLYRYLISLQLSGAIVTQSRDWQHTAYNVVEWHHYFQKRWSEHTALKQMPGVAVPTLAARPSLVRKWAYAIDDIGDKKSELAANHFKTPLALATADEMEWLKLPGVGIPTAQKIVRQIRGMRG